MATMYEREVRAAERFAALRRGGMNKLGSYNEIVASIAEEERRRKETEVHIAACRETSVIRRSEAGRRLLDQDDDRELVAGVAAVAEAAGMTPMGWSTPAMIRAARGKPCPYCGVAMVGGGRGKHRPSRDHLRPRVDGGKLTRHNCLIVCQACNGDKGARTLQRWLVFLERRGDPRAVIVGALVAKLREIGLR